ncbi:hypothetical protein A3SI_11119 [Nitritalea halalkaliphila LW7]|uniref:Uncharacterized protein n=1 Tax=Nitritalea halalkaliphila LW7 TaxID=1189621 RepID=I5C2W9_9BACT|nr:hypothetical protein [Nitritalea halalkaliphila]EIM76171.1 hypothetical protein A3SI_11119 [Nitritalea halalkaliphila LW7]
MPVRYTKAYLDKLESVFASSAYHLRYEKGSFKSGYCILNENKIVIVNKYYTLEGKINTLLDILKELDLDPASVSDKKLQAFLSEIKQTVLKL